MRTFISLALVLALGLGIASESYGAEARALTAADIAAMGGTDFDGGLGDLLLRNDKVEVVILGIDRTPDFGIPIVAEALPGRGVIVDAGTLGDKNDELTEIDQVMNLDGTRPVFYGNASDGLPNPIIVSGSPTSSITIFGAVIFSPFTTGSIIAATTYSLTDGNSYVDMSTTVLNFNPVPVPIWQITDADVIAGRGRLPFQPFPFRGSKPPPLDLSNPIPAAGVFNYVTLPGNNGPSNGPTNNDGSPAGEVSYTILADSVFTPLLGVANGLVTAVGNVGAPGGSIPAFGFKVHNRKLVIAKGNSVQASLDIALPKLLTPVFGFDPRGVFTGRVVDGSGNPVPDAHIFFDNTVPGADPLLVTGFVTVADENQDGVADGLHGPFSGGEVLPTSHTVSAADGTFTARLPLQLFGGAPAIPSVYTARIQAPERATVTVAGLVVSPANIPALGGSATSLGDIAVADTGTLSFTVNNLATSTPGPAKLTILGTNGTENPDFGSQYLSLRNFSLLSKKTGDGLTPVSEGNSAQLSENLVGTPALNFHTDADGTGTLDLKPGTYVVFASRGVEYTIDAQEFTIAAGATTNVTLGIEKVVDTSGFVSMDFHVHSAKSFDSSVPETDRVTAFLAEGVDVMVSTDHDYITDYAPIISALGAGSEIASIVGDELTGGVPVPADATQGGLQAFPEGIGHWNAWPLNIVPNNRRNGAVPDEFITPGTAIDRLRGQDELALLGKRPDNATIVDWVTALNIPGDDEVVMFNHPRAGFAGTVVIGMFNSLFNPGGNPTVGGYNPNLPLAAFPNSLLGTPSLYNALIVGPGGTSTNALSFDAIEVLNGASLGSYVRVRNDWYSLLDQGLNKVGTAVADSHRLVLENAGFSRSFVASSTDDPSAIDVNELTANVKAMKLTGTNGPFIRFEVKDDAGVFHGLGETVVNTNTKLGIKIRVEAAPWIPVEEVRVFRNGTLIATEPIQSTKILGKVLRYNQNLNLEGIDADSYFTVEAGVKINANGQPLNPALLTTVRTIEDGVTPLGFTNPIFVDRDGNGYTPPGQ